eukprot:TRINITY_DN4179_c0_g2_i1.p1 TRINITY_DN4179_c0_g2~~TRINITY_DN4179_c0_g2_i1.p1  ORF type:complete len:103 (-),score=3.35 TRINITY_DN4179_c0_g2_i1:144-452(-)
MYNTRKYLSHTLNGPGSTGRSLCTTQHLSDLLAPFNCRQLPQLRAASASLNAADVCSGWRVAAINHFLAVGFRKKGHLVVVSRYCKTRRLHYVQEYKHDQAR